MKYQTFGASSKEESQREREHRALARRAAAEGIVLLKNDSALPLQPGKIALYVPGSRMTVKGGSGSGDVHERHSVSIEEGLLNAGFTFDTLWMDRFTEKYRADVEHWHGDVERKIKGYGPIRTLKMFDIIHENLMPYPACTPIQDDELCDDTDTAVYVLSRQAGEGKDRRVEKGDNLLSDVESESLKKLSGHYKKLILVLNCGSVIDLSIMDVTRIDAVLFCGQGGMEGGNALADILTGAVTPCGKLTDTWAMRYDDYPCADSYSYRNGDLENEEYAEGIYVGYRWFDRQGIAPRFPFGFGLSLTHFEATLDSVSESAATVTVQNIGAVSGKEVVQVYIAKPEREIDHEKRSLAAFAKTRLLRPGERQTLCIAYGLEQIASFDEARNLFYLEPGEYAVHVGQSVCGSFALTEEKTFPIHRNKKTEEPSERISALLSRLSDKDKIKLVTGGGYALKAYNNVMGAAGRTCTSLMKKGVPNIVLADGPAGINVNQSVVVMKNGFPRYPDGLPEEWRWSWLKYLEPMVKAKPGKGRAVYRYMTAWPSETVLAQSWDMELLEEVGVAIGKEMLEIGVSVWLAPGLNIHRNPLCGRNFEYYSEDPLLSGKMAAAITRGVQSQSGVGVTIKHFCCNNQEDNRNRVSENVSQRALREIYLRGFRIAVTEGKPWTVMSSYNRVNGKYVCNSRNFCTGILREEWGFDGVVMSDWNATDKCSHAGAINAGNDLIMPGSGAVEKALIQALTRGELDRNALNISAGRVLALVFKSAVNQNFGG